jgi:hypothetical protein
MLTELIFHMKPFVGELCYEYGNETSYFYERCKFF